MTIATPIITDFDIDEIAPWSGNRLIDLHMATLPSKPFARFFPWNKNALNLGYQKLRPRYEPMDEITQAACKPLCPEGWYFDCETETCKEYSSYTAYPLIVIYEITSWWHEWHDYVGFKYGSYTTILTDSDTRADQTLFYVQSIDTEFGLLGIGNNGTKLKSSSYTTTVSWPQGGESFGHEIYVDRDEYPLFNLPPCPPWNHETGPWPIGMIMSYNLTVQYELYGVK